MKLLLDTQLLIWSSWIPKKVSSVGRSLINNAENALFFSAANLWEIAIKQSLGKKDFQIDARDLRIGLLDNGYNELSITSDHAIAIRALPVVHKDLKDPFDRILIAQAIVEGLTLLTADAVVARYPGPIKKV